MRRTLVLTALVALVAATLSALVTWSLVRDDAERPPTADPCAAAQEALDSASGDASRAANDARVWAKAHEIYPPASDFPELWQAQALGQDASTWSQMLGDVRLKLRVALQVIDDSPDCFSPGQVAEARALLD